MDGGLEGVVAAETILTNIDGSTGTWLLRGHPLSEVVEAHGYEGASALLWEGFAGSGLARADIEADFSAGRTLAFDRLASWLATAVGRPVGEGVRFLLAALPDESTPAEIAAALPVGVAALIRVKRGEAPVPPDPQLTTAGDFLRMVTGAPAAPARARALDAYLTVVIDNGLAASTFAARVIASTRASLASAVLGAYCALTGPLHGGAPGPVLDMLDAIGTVDNIAPWLERALDRGERLMGFGHRVWRGRDPRADALKTALLHLGSDCGRIAFAEEVERRATLALHRRKPDHRLETNVEFYTALLLEAVGLPRSAFTPVFAMARSVGWLAHAMEQQKTGRLIRPAARYIGPAPKAA